MLGIPENTAATKENTAALRENTKAQEATQQLLRDIKDRDDKIIALLEKITAEPPSQPGHFSIQVTNHVSVGGKTMLQFSIVNLPAVDLTAPNNKDYAKRVLTVTVNGGEPQTFTTESSDAIPAVAADDAGNIFKGEAGDIAAASLVYFDKVGNPSTAREESLALPDVIGPDQPGEFGIQVTGQI